MSSNRIFIVLGSTNISACVKNALGLPMGWSYKKTQGYKNGLISDRVLFIQCLNDVLMDLQVQMKGSVTEVVLGLNGAFLHTNIVQLPLEFPSSKTIDSAVTKKITQMCKQWCGAKNRYLLNMIPLEYKLDGNYVSEVVGLKGKELEASMQLFSADCVAMDNLLETFKKCYLNIVDIVPVPLVLENLVQNTDMKELGMILFDFGGASTTISGFYQGKPLFVEQIPIGGEMLTRRIAQTLNISLEEAERLKCIYGASATSHQDAYEWLEVGLLTGKMLCVNKMRIVELTSGFMQDLMKNMLKSLKHVPGHMKKRVMFTGQASKMHKLNELIDEIFKCDSEHLVVFGEDEKWLVLNGLMSMYKIESRKNSILDKVLKFLGLRNK